MVLEVFKSRGGPRAWRDRGTGEPNPAPAQHDLEAQVVGWLVGLQSGCPPRAFRADQAVPLSSVVYVVLSTVSKPSISMRRVLAYLDAMKQ
jgi:hypothetical protein